MKCEFIERYATSLISICEFRSLCLSDTHKTCKTYTYNLEKSLSKYPHEWSEIHDSLSKMEAKTEWV